jgi:hypothetical protein
VDRQTGRQPDTWIDRQADTWTDRQSDTWEDRQLDRQTDNFYTTMEDLLTVKIHAHDTLYISYICAYSVCIIVNFIVSFPFANCPSACLCSQ